MFKYVRRVVRFIRGDLFLPFMRAGQVMWGAVHWQVMKPPACLFVLLLAALGAAPVIDGDMHHIRSGTEREWETFPETAEGRKLVVHFDASQNPAEQTLRLRQRDVKQVWRVRLNGRELAPLTQDENEIVAYLAVPPGALRDGDNELTVAADGGPNVPSDDVMLGDVALIPRPRSEMLSECGLRVEVTDGDQNTPLPCRITVADERGGLVTLGTPSSPTLAVRPGTVYTADGRADVRLPAGKYTVYAGRGFEYSLATMTIELRPGQTAERKLAIRHVVPTDGYVSCDTHVHTLTYSRHGDATLEERVITLAGEGIELPVATEHNLQVDYGGAAEKAGVRRYFTPVMGNEVTTVSLGHFNVFPIAPGRPLIYWNRRDWDALARGIAEVAPDPPPVVVLNHARDVHGGFRPFDATRFISIAGEFLDGKDPPANAIEVINSGATRADALELVRDWFGLLNRGHRITPVGSSDSHDVSRYIVGQGRTYVRYGDSDPGRIDMDEARRSLLAGRVNVSYGLLAEVAVNGHFCPGDLVPASDTLEVEVRVLGPEWTRATHVTLYANGVVIQEADIQRPAGEPEPAGLKWRQVWTLPRPKRDVYLVAVATGPGVTAPYWPTAKPYQPTSPKWEPYVLGLTGVVWVDADGSGRFDSAYDYAKRIVEECGADPPAIGRKLAEYDGAVAVQAASVLRATGVGDFQAACGEMLAVAGPATRRGIQGYLREFSASRSR